MPLFFLTSIALAQTEEPDVNERLEQLEREVRALREAPAPVEIREVAPPPPRTGLISTEQTKTGLGSVASKIYFQKEAESSFGLQVEFFTFTQRKFSTGAPSDGARTSVASLAPLIAVRFTPRLLFNSQLLFENGGSESRDTVTLQRGQSVVKFAYLDWLAGEDRGVRLGHQLVPVGLTNTSDDPTTFFGVLRPELERALIPGSWHENGVAYWLDRSDVELQAGVFTSLNAAGFRGETFLAGGRAQGQNGLSEDVMAVLRANVKGASYLLGISTALGNAAQSNEGITNAGFRVFEAHARLKSKRARVTAQYVQGDVDDADAISIMNSTTMGSRARGSSLEAAWDCGGLWVFARTSRYNTQDRVPAGWTADPSQSKTVNTFGLSFLPLPTVVLKADYQIDRTKGGLNLGAGFVF